jgi:hypothetical protein
MERNSQKNLLCNKIPVQKCRDKPGEVLEKGGAPGYNGYLADLDRQYKVW